MNAYDGNSTVPDRRAEKLAQSRIADLYSRACFTCVLIIICVMIPSYNRVTLSQRYFQVMHYFRHHFVARHAWIHRLRVYHNKSLQQCIFWCSFVGIFTLHGSQGNFFIVVKKLGRLAVALMPPLLFLTLRPSPLPKTLYLTLLPFHKWIGRIVVLAAFLHSVFYAYVMCANKVLLEKMRKPANLYGLIAMVLFVLIVVTSLAPIRRRAFRVFYTVHYLSTWLVVVLIYMHARPGVPYYTAMSLSILVAQVIYRVRITRVCVAKVQRISPTLTLMEFPLEQLALRPQYPGAHVRIRPAKGGGLARAVDYLVNGLVVPLQHPFTIANLPKDDKIQLIIRSEKFPMRDGMRYHVSGAFEPVINFLTKPRNLADSLVKYRSTFALGRGTQALLGSPLNYIVDSQRVLIVVGGTGISFGLPLLRVLNFNGCLVKLKWAIRDFRDLRILSHIRNNFEGMEVYISGQGAEDEIEIEYTDNDFSENEHTPLLSHHHMQGGSLLDNMDHVGSGNARAMDPGAKRDTKATNSANGVNSANGGYCLRNVARENTADEIDFTDVFKNDTEHKRVPVGVFREPSIIEEQEDRDKKIAIPSGVKVFHGRPRLDQHDYNWCMESECGVNDVSVDKRRVWVVAAGPPGLIDATSRWSTDSGLRFHGESFAV